MDFSTALIITLVSMVFSAFFSGMEIAFITSNRVRIGLDSQKKGITNHLINFSTSIRICLSQHCWLVITLCLLFMVWEWQDCLPLPCLLFQRIRLLLFLCRRFFLPALFLLLVSLFPRRYLRINPNSSLRHFAVFVFLNLFVALSDFSPCLAAFQEG